MKLPGIVTNVTAFGAFVDVGVHQDGLVHISQLSDEFVKNPADFVKVGQRVNVIVQEIDLGRKRIALSMKTNPDLNRVKPGERRTPGSARDVQRNSAGNRNAAPQVDWFTAAMNKKN